MPVSQQRPEEDVKCFDLFLHLIPLRQGLLLDLDFRQVASKTQQRPVSTPYKSGFHTHACPHPAFHVGSRNSYTLLNHLPALHPKCYLSPLEIF